MRQQRKADFMSASLTHQTARRRRLCLVSPSPGQARRRQRGTVRLNRTGLARLLVIQLRCVRSRSSMENATLHHSLSAG